MAQLKKGGLGRGLGALLKGVDIAAPVAEPAVAETRHTESSVKNAPARDEQNRASKPARAESTSPGLSKQQPQNPTGTSDADNPALDGTDAVSEILIEDISRGTYQPRTHFDDEALQELADSISAQGLIQPVLLRKRGGGYELIAGERRWRAAKMIGMVKIPAIVREMDDSAVAAVTLIENIQREDLNPFEEAQALHRLKNEFEMTHQDVADAVGRSRAAVSNLLRLLDLDDRVAEMLATGKIEMGHARALLSLSGEEQHILAMKVYASGLSVRATENLVRNGGASKPAKTDSAKPRRKMDKSSHIKTLENDLADKLGAPVSINHRPGNKGSITLTYNSLDELDGILGHIK